mmetsp:Transcript_36363/g.83565  ORF Transcript_36363/g.83565 Transcript_36363/m.83565 type:complete len:508 (+) Transcript_36363:73-1596(+)
MADAKDVEMKDAEKAKGDEKKEGEAEEKKTEAKDPKVEHLEALAATLHSIHKALIAGDVRAMARVVRSFNAHRKKLVPEVLKTLLEEVVSKEGEGAEERKAFYLKLVPVDAPMTEEDKTQAVALKLTNLPKPYPPEFEAYAVVMLLIWLLDKKENTQALECANTVVTWVKTFNRRSLDVLAARAYFYLSLAYEKNGRFSDIRAELQGAYRTSCLRHDVAGKATLLNLILRNYLAYNLYEQAWKFVQKTTFPESRPNTQYARYLFYKGQISAVQLEYSEAHSKLMQAIRKAPQGTSVALGFKLAATKHAVIVELLMGGIPDRSTFMQKELREQLRPYYAITQAVRSGDLNAFREVMQSHEALFKKDKTLTLINRLRYNVIKTGLRSINLSYSRISLQDICGKLGLESPQDAAGIVAKAVVDGVIDATIDYDEQYLKSTQRHNLYSSCEPQKAFHKRIEFCLQMHNETVKAMAYPEENAKGTETAEERREREKAQLANVDDQDDDMDAL